MKYIEIGQEEIEYENLRELFDELVNSLNIDCFIKLNDRELKDLAEQLIDIQFNYTFSEIFKVGDFDWSFEINKIDYNPIEHLIEFTEDFDEVAELIDNMFDLENEEIWNWNNVAAISEEDDYNND